GCQLHPASALNFQCDDTRVGARFNLKVVSEAAMGPMANDVNAGIDIVKLHLGKVRNAGNPLCLISPAQVAAAGGNRSECNWLRMCYGPDKVNCERTAVCGFRVLHFRPERKQSSFLRHINDIAGPASHEFDILIGLPLIRLKADWSVEGALPGICGAGDTQSTLPSTCERRPGDCNYPEESDGCQALRPIGCDFC